jgi:4-amino-4-deoxy-L-arabinose transferase-like glycosyltransferase
VRLFSAACLGIAGGLSVMLALIMATRTGLPTWAKGFAAVTTGGMAMADQTIRTYAVDFLSEPLSLVLTTGMLLTAILALRRSDDRWWLGVAILVGLMILTRSLMIFWLPGLALLIGCSQPRNGGWRALSFILAVVLCLTPWGIRNVRWLESFMPLGTQGLISLLGGYSDEALSDGNWHPEAERRLRRLLDTQPDAAERSVLEREVATARAASREVRRWAVAHAADLPGLACLRLQQHWGPFRGKTLLWRLAMLSGMLWLILARCREAWWFLGLPVLSSLCVMLLYETGGRFLVPLYGLMYSLAGIGIAAWLAWLIERMAASRTGRRRRLA